MILSWLLFAASLVLQAMVLNSLRRGAYRTYSFVFAYSLVLFFTTVWDGLIFSRALSFPKALADLYFYRNEAVRQFMLFGVVIALIDRSLKSYQHRGRARIFLTMTVLTSVCLSLSIHSASASRFILWMTQVARDLSFGAVVLTLLLWLTLISSRKKDYQLLMVIGGLGLQFTGEAIGQSLRQIGMHDRDWRIQLAGNLIAGLAQVLRLYVWSQAFRRTATSDEKEEEPDGKQRKAFPHPAQTFFETAVN
jgi:hypothetical protein